MIALKENSVGRKFCCVYDGITAVSLNFKPQSDSVHAETFTDCNVRMKIEENASHLSISEKCFTTITQNHIQYFLINYIHENLHEMISIFSFYKIL